MSVLFAKRSSQRSRMTETTEAPRRNPSPCLGTPRLNPITRTGASRRNPSLCKRTPPRKQTLRTEESALIPSCDITGCKSMESTRTIRIWRGGRKTLNKPNRQLPAVASIHLLASLNYDCIHTNVRTQLIRPAGRILPCVVPPQTHPRRTEVPLGNAA